MKHKVNLKKLLLSVIVLCLMGNMLLQSAYQMNPDHVVSAQLLSQEEQGPAQVSMQTSSTTFDADVVKVAVTEAVKEAVKAAVTEAVKVAVEAVKAKEVAEERAKEIEKKAAVEVARAEAAREAAELEKAEAVRAKELAEERANETEKKAAVEVARAESAKAKEFGKKVAVEMANAELERVVDSATTKENQAEFLRCTKAFQTTASTISDEETETDCSCRAESADLAANQLESVETGQEAQVALEKVNQAQKDAEKKSLDTDEAQQQILIQKKAEVEAAKIELEVEKAIAKRNFRRAVQLVHANESLVDAERLLAHIDQEQRDFDCLIIGALDRLRSRDFSRAMRTPTGRLDAEFFFGEMSSYGEAMYDRDFFTAWILLRRFLTSGRYVAQGSAVIESGAEELAISGYALFLLNHYQDGIEVSAIPPTLKEGVLDKLEEETRLMIDKFRREKHDSCFFYNNEFRTQVKQLLINLAALWLLANGEEIEEGLDLPGIEKAIKKAFDKGKCRHPRKLENSAGQAVVKVVEHAVLKIPGITNESPKETKDEAKETLN